MIIPFAIVSLVIFTVLVIICVYIKDRISLTRYFKKSNQSAELYESEMLRKHFNNQISIDAIDVPDHLEKKKIMNFYIGMMKKEVF